MEKKCYVASQQTKWALAAALKKLMAQKPLEKITISELTDLCHIKRQNFYYHFEDIYDLMRWMFQNEAVSLLERREGALLWREGLLELFHYLQSNRAVCLCALRSLGRGHIRRFFEEQLHTIISQTIEGFLPDLQDPSSSDHVALLAHFYVVSLASVMESWLLGEIDQGSRITPRADLLYPFWRSLFSKRLLLRRGIMQKTSRNCDCSGTFPISISG